MNRMMWAIALGVALCGRAMGVGLNVQESPPNLPPEPAKPVPFLTGEEAIKTFKIDPGFHVELVACEPMVQHPVAMAWDADGRLWVVEMRGYMPDVFGNHEKDTIGRISILEDTNGDGRMDKSTVFLDNLVLPRAIGLVRGGALIAEPPNVLFCRDANGDGVCDEKTIIAKDYGTHGNPEHQPNGLMTAIDNWIYNANYGHRFKFLDNKWITDDQEEVGQWGITQDNFGRLFFNSNSDQLRGNLIPDHYADRNPNFHGSGINVQIAKDQRTWPINNTAIDRGYIKGNRHPDGSIFHFTAASAPVIDRGGIFPADYAGNAFVPEPSGNMIKRDVLVEKDGTIAAKNAYEGKEFFASTYERFRPVNMYTGPDGAMYIVDMHHGLLQHVVYLTAYCRGQYLARQLDKFLMTGRIYRIVPDNAKLFDKPHMSTDSTEKLVGYLAHPNGWWRDTAQRLLVERDDSQAVPLLREMATTSPNALARLHALWTLDGMRKLDVPTLLVALDDAHSKIRAAAIRLGETALTSPFRDAVLPVVLNRRDDADPDVRLQFALTMSGVGIPQTDAAVAHVLTSDAESQYVRDAAISGMGGRELGFLAMLLNDGQWSARTPGRTAIVTSLAKCVMTEGKPKRIEKLLSLTAAQSQTWRQLAILSGMADLDKRKAARGIGMEKQPLALVALLQSKDAVVNQTAKLVAKIVHWPGKPGYVPPPPPKPLTSIEQARFEIGRQVYGTICVQCHKANGMGQEGLAPPLATSEWIDGPPERLARIVLLGLHGVITVDGHRYALEMPGVPVLDDEKIAGALTFVRRSWEHEASAVDPELIKEIRKELIDRQDPFTERQLLKIAETHKARK